MSEKEQELLLAKRNGVLNEDGSLKSGFHIRSNVVGKEDREVLQLIQNVVVETPYGKGVFHSRVREIVIGQVFV